MDTVEAILTRRSVRNFTRKPIEAETLRLLLEAAMSAPSATNAKDWEFIIVTARQKLVQMADGNGKYAQPLRSAAAGILICGNLEKAVPAAKDFWVIDCANAAENLCLCAHALGLGSVWLGTWPRADAVSAQSSLFSLPAHIVPHSILALGYPADSAGTPRKSRYDASCVHAEAW